MLFNKDGAAGMEVPQPSIPCVSRSQVQRSLHLMGTTTVSTNQNAFISLFDFQERGSAEGNRL